MQLTNVKLFLNGEWSLLDLSECLKLYVQSYSLFYSLNVHDGDMDDELSYIYSKYPWQGGYSTVNFYKNLYGKIPYDIKPELKSIQYNSPGFIEISVAAAVAKNIAIIIAAVCGSVCAINKTHHSIQKGLSERKLLKLNIKEKEVHIESEKMAYIKESLDVFSKYLNISKELLEELEIKTEGNQLAKLKILLSFYRRIEPLVKWQNEGKLIVEVPDSNNPLEPQA